MSTPGDQRPTIPVLYRYCDDELIAIFPTLPGAYGLDTMEAHVWADGFVTVDLGYISNGVPVAASAYNNMHRYLIKRFADDATLNIIEAIEPQHHEERHARLKSSIAALRAGTGSPPWTPAALAELRASEAALTGENRREPLAPL